MTEILPLFRKSVVVFYWIVLVILIALCGGWISTLFLIPTSPQSWLMAGGTALFALLIGWRLWLNNRALGRTSQMPSTRRVLTVFVPLGALALFGGALGCVGLGWIASAIWILTTSTKDPAVIGLPFGNVGLLAAFGAVLIGLAFVSMRPFIVRLRHRAPTPDVF